MSINHKIVFNQAKLTFLHVISQPLYWIFFLSLVFYYLTMQNSALYGGHVGVAVWIFSRNKRLLLVSIIYLLTALVTPAIIIISVYFLILSIISALKFDSWLNQFLGNLKSDDDFTSGLNMVFMRTSLFMIWIFLVIAVQIPIVSSTYRYQGTWREALDIGYSLYFTFLLVIFVYYSLIKMNGFLVKSAINNRKNHDSIIKNLSKLILIVIISITIPDVLFALVYSYTFSMYGYNYGPAFMYQFAFMLHHQVPMLNYFEVLLERSQTSLLTMMVKFVHVMTVKIIDTTIVGSVIITVFGEIINKHYGRLKARKSKVKG